MIFSILSIVFAILGLSFLIFIHELGHYYIARREGMRVETFSIGIGRPIYHWMRDGVKWQIGWLLFGGYVKIAGMESSDKTKDIRDVPDGFFAKSPIARIKVAIAGPIANIIFAFLAFVLLWSLGGREKHFSEYTKKIGWVDPKSELYAMGVRPGDEITAFGSQPYQSSKDLLYAPMTAKETLLVKGNKVDPLRLTKTPYSYTVKPYSHPEAIEKEILTSGILHPAGYLIYNKLPNGMDNPLPEGSPLRESGIQYNDRVVWVDGHLIYSLSQLNNLMNESRALLTIKRGNSVLLKRVPRVTVDELKLDPDFKEELTDWQYEAQLNNIKFMKMVTIPYNLNNEGVVEKTVPFIDKDNEQEAFPEHTFSEFEQPLLPGDRIVAVDGIPVTRSYEIIKELQKHRVNIIVERSEALKTVPSWREIDHMFELQVDPEDLHTLVSQIGVDRKKETSGNLVWLKPVVPKPRSEFVLSPENQALVQLQKSEQKKDIEAITDPEKRAQAMHQLDNIDKQLLLGLPLSQDQKIDYNPNPIDLFNGVLEEIWHTLKALFTGSLNPKWMSGPIGIVSVVQKQSMVSLKEALYWLGLISLNLGILNLLPIPVLDGGNICFSLFELATGIKMKPKTMEKLIIPFAILLIGFFLFLSYNDVMRLIGGMFKR